MPSPDEGRTKVFISYSHKDDAWLKRLQVHLKPLERDGLIDRWDDTRIRAGSQWRNEIISALNTARVAVLLISADFMASDFIATDELPSLLASAEQKGVVILPLIVSPSRFEKTESLSCFQSVNSPSKPLIALEKVDQEQLLVKLTEDILSALQGPSSEGKRTNPPSRRQASSLPIPRNDYLTGSEDSKVADISSRRNLVGVVITALLAGVTAIAVAVINNCGNGQKPMSSSNNPVPHRARIHRQNVHRLGKRVSTPLADGR